MIGGLKKDTLTFFENVIAACRADDYGKNRFQEYQPGVWAKKMSTAAMSITGETLLQKVAEASTCVRDVDSDGLANYGHSSASVASDVVLANSDHRTVSIENATCPEGEEFGRRLRELRIGAIRQQKHELKRILERKRS